jgi:tetratricopeptide (TPR) repeat protein
MTTDMTPERWAAIGRVLDQLHALRPEERQGLLDGLDEHLRRDVATYSHVDPRVLDEVLPTDTGDRVDPAEVVAGRYRLVRPLGRGGMGSVDLAHDLELDRPVAIKRLSELRLDDAEARRRLRHEGRALAALDHPHIARVQDVLDTSPPALVMEYVDGLPLGRWLNQPREAAEALGVVRTIVEAVGYAHGRGVVHCDLKPGNVLVTRGGLVKVVDFGIAQMRSLVADTTVTSEATREIAYTRRFAAPEVKRGATPTPASDVYSLGVLIGDVVEACDRAGAPLPVSLVQSLGRVAREAQADQPLARPQDGAALAALIPLRPEAPAGQVPARSWRMLAVPGLIVASSCLGGGLSLVGDKVVAASPVPIIAVVPRIDASASATVSAGAADLVRAGLSPLTRARLVEGEVPVLQEDVPDLVSRLRDQGLSHVVIPTVAPFGSGVRMSVVIYLARNGQAVKTFTRHGRVEAMGTLAREVAGQVRAWLGEPNAVLPEIATTFQPTPEALELYSQARQYSSRPDKPGALVHARALLERVIQVQPDFAQAHAELGRVLLQQYLQAPAPELVIAAQDAMVEAQRQGADLEEVQLALAVAKQMTGRREEAIPYLHRVLDGDPDNADALRMLGAIEVERGRPEGLDMLKRAALLRPSFQNHRALGRALYGEGRYEEALVAFQHLAVLQPDNPWSYQMIGATHQVLKHDDLAREFYERSIEVRPTASTLTNYGTFLYARGDLEQAERRYAEAVAIEPFDPALHRNLADAQLQRGRRDAARETYARAVEAAEALLKVNPGDVRALGNAAYAAARVGDCAASQASADRLASLAPTQVPALANRANALAICGQHTQSATILQALAARGRAPAVVLEKDVWATVAARPEYRGLGAGQ